METAPTYFIFVLMSYREPSSILLSSVAYLQNWSNLPPALIISHLFSSLEASFLNLQPARAKFNTSALNKERNQ